LFADDCFLFCRSNISETTKLMEILKTYELASGQEINLSKSEVFFSRNMSRAAQEDLSNIMGVKQVLGTGTYLGLPSMVGRSKKDTFAYIKDRIWKRINGWRSRPLSRAGKEVMIKSVLQAIPAYIMNIYLLPDTLISEIERMINAFWWSGGNNNGGIRWLAWSKLTRPKGEGGLGFRDFHSFNMAMVAKQGWKFMHDPTSLVARLYKARYFPKHSFLESNIGNNPSFAWRSIWRSREVLSYGCRWQIGDGSKIKVMHEPWLRTSDACCLRAPQNREVYNITVHDLLLSNMKRWDENKIISLFPVDVAHDIIAVPLLEVVTEDRLIWREEKDGVYSVRSGYRVYMKQKNRGYGNNKEDGWRNLWKIHAPPKVKHLLWRVCSGCLPTRPRLRTRYVNCPSECPMCSSCEEEEQHLFLSCDMIREAWEVMGLAQIILSRLHRFTNIRDIFFDICRLETAMVAGKCATLLWFAWQNRNNKVWNNDSLHARQIGDHAARFWCEWAATRGLLHDHEQPLSSAAAPAEQHATTWQQPPLGYLKCNVDASFYNLAGSTGWGWILRDSNGDFKLAGTNIVNTPFSVVEGEAMALAEAMKEMLQRGLSYVVFESDSKIVVDAISSRQSCVSEFSLLISYIQSILSLHNYFEVKYVRRQANKVAHHLARAAFSMSRRRIYDSVPPCISSYLNNERC
jgi:ribonuclease HI